MTSTYYSISHLWKAMFTSVCGALLFRVSRAYGSLALFRLTDFSVQVTPRPWRGLPLCGHRSRAHSAVDARGASLTRSMVAAVGASVARALPWAPRWLARCRGRLGGLRAPQSLPRQHYVMRAAAGPCRALRGPAEGRVWLSRRGCTCPVCLAQDADAGLSAVLYTGEIYAFALLGVLCGMLGAAFVHATASLVQLVRQLRASLKPSSRVPRRRRDLPSPRTAPGGPPHFGLRAGTGAADGASGAGTCARPNGVAVAYAGAPLAPADVAHDTPAGAGAPPTLSSPSPPTLSSSSPSLSDADRRSFGTSSRDVTATASGGGGGGGGGCDGCDGCGCMSGGGGGPSCSDGLACTAESVFAALLSRYGYTLVVAFTSAMLTFPFGFFGSSPEDVIVRAGAAPTRCRTPQPHATAARHSRTRQPHAAAARGSRTRRTRTRPSGPCGAAAPGMRRAARHLLSFSRRRRACPAHRLALARSRAE